MKELKGVVPTLTKQRGDLYAKYSVHLPKLGTDMFGNNTLEILSW